jgi:hypothetical protein
LAKNRDQWRLLLPSNPSPFSAKIGEFLEQFIADHFLKKDCAQPRYVQKTYGSLLIQNGASFSQTGFPNYGYF